MSSNPAGKAFLGVVVVVLCGASAWLGGTLARPDLPTPGAGAGPGTAAPGADREFRDRLDELERAVDNLNRKQAETAEMARVAIDQAQAANERAATVPPAATAPTAPGPEGPTLEPPRELTDAEREAEIKKVTDEMMARIGPDFARHQFKLIAGTTYEESQQRRGVAAADARSTGISMGVGGAGEMKLREILGDQLEAIHMQVGPLVAAGLDKSDLTAVHEKLTGIWEETDRRVHEAFTADQEKQWTLLATGTRARLASAFETIRASQPK